MSKKLPFFAAEPDDAALREFVSSLGLHILPVFVDLVGRPLESSFPFVTCFISALPPTQVAVTQHTRPRFNPALTPLLQFTRSYRKGPELIGGRLWSYSSDLRPSEMDYYFDLIEGWIRERWVADLPFWIGPCAHQQHAAGEVQLHSIPLSTRINIIHTPDYRSQ